MDLVVLDGRIPILDLNSKQRPCLYKFHAHKNTIKYYFQKLAFKQQLLTAILEEFFLYKKKQIKYCRIALIHDITGARNNLSLGELCPKEQGKQKASQAIETASFVNVTVQYKLQHRQIPATWNKLYKFL